MGMTLDLDKLRQPFRKLRKRVRTLSKKPTAEEVHELRTLARRLEAIVAASKLQGSKDGRALLKALEPVRKAAGQVRDLDVFVGFAAGLSGREEEDACRTRLLEAMGARRVKLAGKLRRTVAKREETMLVLLKRCLRDVEKEFAAEESAASVTAAALAAAAELSRWPTLDRGNLHPFRMKVKTLRYTLELAEGEESKLIAALGVVKDGIGAWHDWNELAGVANKTLEHGVRCGLRRQIDQMTKTKLADALMGANRMRARYFAGGARALRGAAAKTVAGMV